MELPCAYHSSPHCTRTTPDIRKNKRDHLQICSSTIHILIITLCKCLVAFSTLQNYTLLYKLIYLFTPNTCSLKLGPVLVAHNFNHSTWAAGASGSVSSRPGWSTKRIQNSQDSVTQRNYLKNKQNKRKQNRNFHSWDIIPCQSLRVQASLFNTVSSRTVTSA